MSMALIGPSGRIALDAPIYTFGRTPDNQVVLYDPKVSPRHAALQLQGQQYSIVDLGSIDGTYLNEQRLGPNMSAFLKHGDRIRLGNTQYTFEASPLAASAYLPTMAASSSPAYGQSFPSYPAGNFSAPGYLPHTSSDPAAPYAPAAGQPWGASLPPAYTPPAPAKKKGSMKVLLIALVVLLVFGIGGGVALYVVNLPQPTISVKSTYTVGSTPVGASATSFQVSGKKFSHSSDITFLLDGTTAPGSQVAHSDNNGSVTAKLTVTDAWTVGKHTLTAKDVAGYVTKTSVSLTIVSPGQDKTPGPHGAPTDSATMTIDATLKASDGSSAPLTLTVKPGANGSGTVCRDIDNGQPRTLSGTTSDGVPYTEVATDTCSGTYQGGRLIYAETVTSDQMTFTSGALKGEVCTAQTPYVVNHMEGTFTSPTDISGSFSIDGFSLTCKLGTISKTSNVPGGQGTWTGTANT